jgi:PAS domain S-box-containing protein
VIRSIAAIGAGSIGGIAPNGVRPRVRRPHKGRRRQHLCAGRMTTIERNDAQGPLGMNVEAAALYRLLVESVRDYAIFALDPTGHIISWNAGAERFKGYAADEIIGNHFSIFYPAEDLARGKPALELEVTAREGRLEDEGWRIRKDGSRFWANVVITALRDDTGTLLGFAKVTRDLTERVAAEERAIADARRLAEAEGSNRVKSQFLASMSHELRTPLNAIGGYAQLIEMGLSGLVTDQQREYLTRIRTSQQHLLRIINDLLNYSKIEAGKLTYERHPVPLASVIETVTSMISPQATSRGITLRRGECLNDVIGIGDRLKIEQIVLNLLTNAVKFTPPGGTVTIACRNSGENAVITVGDTGQGIPADKVDEIFEPFVQLGRSLSSGHEGAGLGLAISRDLARAMNGDVTVESTPGKGSLFTLALPKA